MAAETILDTIEIDPESDLAKALASAGRKTVLLVSNGDRYLVTRAEDEEEKTGADREDFLAALRAAAGTFTPEEGERLKRDIYRWREEGTRPANRP